MKFSSYIIGALLLGCGGERPVTVFAAASLREVVSEAAGPGIRTSFEATSTLARQIREGAEADVFIAADPAWLEGLPVLARTDWLGNRLVAIYPERMKLRSSWVGLSQVRSLALANETVPAGRYALEALRNSGIPLPPKVIYCSNVRDVVMKVTTEAAEAGIVYATDLEGVTLMVGESFPEESHTKIVYAAALLTERGRPFFESLRSERVREIARRRGFKVPP